MLGRKDYTQDEIDAARSAVDRQLTAYRKLVKALDKSDPTVAAALAAFEPELFNCAALALDRRFVHRIRTMSGKGTTPLNELELITESVMANEATFRGTAVIKYVASESVLGLEPGQRIGLDAEQFDALAHACLVEVEKKSS